VDELYDLITQDNAAARPAAPRAKVKERIR
jgi:hypothetical protein